MKPFEPRELLARIRSVLRRTAAEPAPAPAPDGGYHRKFWIPTGRGQIWLPVEAIECIEAAKDYALLHTRERSHMIRVTMAGLEKGVDPADLMRIHRSAFVRPDAVESVSQVGRHTILVLRSGGSVRVGPQHVGEVRHRLRR